MEHERLWTYLLMLIILLLVYAAVEMALSLGALFVFGTSEPGFHEQNAYFAAVFLLVGFLLLIQAGREHHKPKRH